MLPLGALGLYRHLYLRVFGEIGMDRVCSHPRRSLLNETRDAKGAESNK